jgi:hypothetical protein
MRFCDMVDVVDQITIIYVAVCNANEFGYIPYKLQRRRRLV